MLFEIMVEQAESMHMAKTQALCQCIPTNSEVKACYALSLFYLFFATLVELSLLLCSILPCRTIQHQLLDWLQKSSEIHIMFPICCIERTGWLQYF